MLHLKNNRKNLQFAIQRHILLLNPLQSFWARSSSAQSSSAWSSSATSSSAQSSLTWFPLAKSQALEIHCSLEGTALPIIMRFWEKWSIGKIKCEELHLQSDKMSLHPLDLRHNLRAWSSGTIFGHNFWARSLTGSIKHWESIAALKGLPYQL